VDVAGQARDAFPESDSQVEGQTRAPKERMRLGDEKVVEV